MKHELTIYGLCPKSEFDKPSKHCKYIRSGEPLKVYHIFLFGCKAA